MVKVAMRVVGRQKWVHRHRVQPRARWLSAILRAGTPSKEQAVLVELIRGDVHSFVVSQLSSWSVNGGQDEGSRLHAWHGHCSGRG